MKILIYGINYAPELTGIGKYSAEMAEWLAARGHSVSVVTAPPYYPQWRVHDGYRAGRYAREERAGVSVRRAPLWVPARPGGVKRLLHLASFALSSLPSLLRAAAGRPDVILVVEPALFCAPAAWLAARLCGARAWLHVQDYEVDAAFELGLLKGAWLRRAVARAERWLMRRFDRVSTISERMLALARDKGVEPARAVLLPNWIDAQAITPDLDGGAYRAQLGIPADAIVALYSGNMGGKQGLQVLADVTRRLEGETRLWFVFCGQGPERAALQARCAGLARARFLDLQPAERLGELLCMADIHLLPQRAGGRPRHAVQADRHAGQRPSGGLRRRAGHGTGGRDHALRPVDSPEDAAAMAEAVLSLAQDGAARAALGQAARRHALAHLHVDAVLGAAERELAACRPGQDTGLARPRRLTASVRSLRRFARRRRQAHAADQPQLHGDIGGLGLVARIELPVQRARMALHGGHRYAHLLADLAHGLALHQQLRDLRLPLRQLAQLQRRRGGARQRPASRLRIAFASRLDQADRGRQGVRAGCLGQIAGHARASASRHHRLIQHGIQHHRQPGPEEGDGLCQQRDIVLGDAAATDHQHFHRTVERSGQVEHLGRRDRQDVVRFAHALQHMLDGDAKQRIVFY